MSDIELTFIENSRNHRSIQYYYHSCLNWFHQLPKTLIIVVSKLSSQQVFVINTYRIEVLLTKCYFKDFNTLFEVV